MKPKQTEPPAGSFSDSNGQVWALKINVGRLEKIRDDLGLDFLDSFDQLDKVTLREMAGILWICCESQAAERQVSPEAFGEALGGAAMSAGIDAFMDRLAFFFEDLAPVKAVALRAIWAKAKEVEVTQLATLTKALGSLSTESRGLSGSTLDRSNSGN